MFESLKCLLELLRPQKGPHLHFIEYNNVIFDDEQFGFQDGGLVISAGIDFIEPVIDSIGAGELVVGVFMDMSKAFDSASYKKKKEHSKAKLKFPRICWRTF